MIYLERIAKQYQEIAEQTPADTKEKATKSFVYSFALTTGLSGNPFLGFAAGVVAATASLVHAATAPLFRKLCEENENPNEAKWYQNLARMVICLSAGSLVAMTLCCRLQIVAAMVLNSAIVLAYNGFNGHNLNKSAFYLI